MRVERKDRQFRVVTQAFSTVWLEDTPSNRKAMVVLLRSLQEESGRCLFTYEQLAQLLGSLNRQAAHGIAQEFGEGGRDMRGFLERKRKVDREVVEAVELEFGADVWAGMEVSAKRVNGRLGREDLTASNMVEALGQVSG